MNRKISVLVEVDLDGRYVRVNVTGALTEVNQQGLCPVVRRARATLPGATVTVDLTCVHDLEPAAVDLLRWAVEQDDGNGSPVEILTPRETPGETAAAALDARRRLRAKVLRRRSAELPLALPELELDAAS